MRSNLIYYFGNQNVHGQKEGENGVKFALTCNKTLWSEFWNFLQRVYPYNMQLGIHSLLLNLQSQMNLNLIILKLYKL